MTALARLYSHYNRRYFGGHLPKKLLVRYKHLSSVYYAIMGYDEKRPKFIYINTKLRKWPEIVRMNLLHEMAHIATIDEEERHGPRWHREMKRLAREGAFDELW